MDIYIFFQRSLITWRTIRFHHWTIILSFFSTEQHEHGRFGNNRYPHCYRPRGGSRRLGCVRLSQSSQHIRTNADQGKKSARQITNPKRALREQMIVDFSFSGYRSSSLFIRSSPRLNAHYLFTDSTEDRIPIVLLTLLLNRDCLFAGYIPS